MSEEKKSETAGAGAQKRDRKPSLKTRDERMPIAHDSEKRQSQLQKRHAEQHAERGRENEERKTRQVFDTKLATDAFVGRHPDEPVKSEDDEARKVGVIGRGRKVKTVPQKTDGMVTDQVVVDPLPHAGLLPGATPLTEPQKTQEVLDEHTGRRGADKSGGSSKKERAEAQKAADQADT
jgi:hypothetical protein